MSRIARPIADTATMPRLLVGDTVLGRRTPTAALQHGLHAVLVAHTATAAARTGATLASHPHTHHSGLTQPPRPSLSAPLIAESFLFPRSHSWHLLLVEASASTVK